MVAEAGVRPRRGRDLQGRYLSFSEREEIALAPKASAGDGICRMAGIVDVAAQRGDQSQRLLD
jgi:transposase, IS30 family